MAFVDGHAKWFNAKAVVPNNCPDIYLPRVQAMRTLFGTANAAGCAGCCLTTAFEEDDMQPCETIRYCDCASRGELLLSPCDQFLFDFWQVKQHHQSPFQGITANSTCNPPRHT
jgi:hypothetical protein